MLINPLLSNSYLSRNSFYTVITPKRIHPNSVHNVSISTHLTTQETKVRLEIKCKPHIGKTFTFSHEVTVPPNSTKNVNFRFDGLPGGKFNFTAKGTKGIIFDNWTRLLYIPKSMLVFIQTDKRIYKPNSFVRYRIIALDSDLKVIPNTRNINVTIYNSNNLKIKELTNAQLNDHGLFTADMPLSRNIDYGFYTIRVTVENTDEVFLEQFEVAEYKLPNFRVQVDAPKWSTFNTRSFKSRIRANYNFGKPLTGNYTAYLSPQPFEGYPKQVISTKTGTINGSAIVEFLFKGDLKIQQKYDRQYILDVTVQDALNGQRQNSSSALGVYVNDYKIMFANAPDYFKPGLHYHVKVRVLHHNNQPIDHATAENVTLYYGHTYETSIDNTMNVTLDKHGVAYGEIKVPSNATKLYVQAEYKDASIELPHILRERTKRKAFVLAKILTERPVVDEDVLIEVTSTHKMSKLTYLLIGKDAIVFANTVPVKNQSKIILKFNATSKMVPRADLLVYFMTQNGFIASDSLQVNVDMKEVFQIRLDKSVVEPGEMVNITVTAAQDSCVNLLALDESVLLLKGHQNDITRQSVLENFKSYSTNDQLKFQRRTLEAEDRRHVNFKNFRDAGMVLFTNAVKIRKKNVLFQQASGSDVDNQLLSDEQGDSDEGSSSTAVGGHDDNDDGDDELSSLISAKDILLRRNAFNIRKQFPETWLWWDVVKQTGNELILTSRAPDSITKWIINGFSVDKEAGLTIAAKKVALTVFKPFFVKMDVPVSINRGEMLTVPVVLHNYSNRTYEVDLIFHNQKKEFCFDTLSICTASYKVRVQVPNNTELPLTFRVTPYKAGQVALKVSAFSNDTLLDRVERFLKVRPEGETRYLNQAFFVDLREQRDFEILLEPHIPRNYIPDSLDIQVRMMKNIMQSSMENLDALVRLPQGCGEQNLLSLVPNVVVMDYMQGTRQKNELLKQKSMRFLQQSYQRQLRFRHPNGAYSTFGKVDEIGNVWLTAYVVRSINWAKKYITVDQKVQNRALKWLNSTQKADGSWEEVGSTIRDSIDKYSIGENGTIASLTAFTLWTFLEHPKGFVKYNDTIERSISFLNGYIDHIRDPYSIALTAYVLQLAGQDRDDQYLRRLQVTNRNVYQEKVWWSPRFLKSEEELKRPASALDIEITSYALLAALKAYQLQDAAPVIRWLVSQRNSNGGFRSSQDTIMGLYALSKVALEFRKLNNHLNFTVNNVPIKDFANMKVFKLDHSSMKRLVVHATGSGAGIVELVAKYNVVPDHNATRDEFFTILPTVENLMDDNLINITVCTRYNSNSKFGLRWWQRHTNMAIVEVNLPSGYKMDYNSYASLKLGQDHLQVRESVMNRMGLKWD